MAKEHLTKVVDAVVPLRVLFEANTEIPPDTADVRAAAVVNACGGLTDWLSGARAPKGLGKAEGELGSVAGVYRNAAFALRSLADTEVNQREARSSACAKLLEQGGHHVETFVAILERKVGA